MKCVTAEFMKMTHENLRKEAPKLWEQQKWDFCVLYWVPED